MAAQRVSIVKVASVAVLALVGMLLAPRAAEAQARGTLQATATVINTRSGFDALRAAQSAVDGATGRRSASQNPVATVAQVSVERPSARPATLVVTIAYALN